MANRKPLPYGRHDVSDGDIQAVIECLRGDWLTQGPKVAEFEEALCAVAGARFAVAVTNGTAALHLANLALGVGPGDLGITSAITFVASANAIRYVGGDVEFADVDPRSGLIDVEGLAVLCEQLTRSGRAPKVLVPVDLGGQPADLPRVRSIADRYGALVVEDAAHSLGATYGHDGQTYAAGCCVHSDAAILSFHPVKHITTAEGGAVLTNDETVCRRLRDLRTHGIHKDQARLTRGSNEPWVGPWYYEMDALGYNFRISDMQCALGLAQMNRLEAFVARRREIAAKYDELLAQSPLAGKLRPLRQHPNTRSSYHLYVVQLVPGDRERPEQMASRRKQLYLYLRSQEIYCQVHYIPVPWQPYYSSREALGELRGAEAYYAACLSLPMYPAMSDADVQRVVEALSSWVEGGSRCG